MSQETFDALRAEFRNMLHSAPGHNTDTLRAALDAHDADEKGESKPKRTRATKAKDGDDA